MPEEDRAQKTEVATPKRREDARKEGQVAQSRELQSVVVLGTATLVAISPMGANLLEQIVRALHASIAAAANPPGTVESFHAMTLGFVQPVAYAVAPMIVTVAGVASLTQVAQTGPMFSPEALMPKASRISLIAGAKRMVDMDRIVELVKAFFKIASVGLVGWYAIRARVDELVGLASASSQETAIVIGEVVLAIAMSIVFVLGLMAAIDFFYQRYRYEERLKMSKREVRDEMKQSEGDPAMKGEIRARMKEVSRSRMIAAVADADVVITNPTHFAVALRYDRETMASPQVVAKGRGFVAQRMREAAREHGVTIVENPPLARLLHRSCEVGREVPEKLFQAVAEVLAYVYRLDPRHRAKGPSLFDAPSARSTT